MAERGGFLGRLFRKKSVAAKEVAAAIDVPLEAHDPAEIATVDDVVIACAAGISGGVPLAESLAAFARLRASSSEARALDALLLRDQTTLLPEEMAIRVASAVLRLATLGSRERRTRWCADCAECRLIWGQGGLSR